MFENSNKWKTVNKSEPSSAFSLEFIEKFATDTANDFIKWVSVMQNER